MRERQSLRSPERSSQSEGAALERSQEVGHIRLRGLSQRFSVDGFFREVLATVVDWALGGQRTGSRRRLMRMTASVPTSIIPSESVFARPRGPSLGNMPRQGGALC